MGRVIKKVTGFVIRLSEKGTDLLLFHHPISGIQIPAGTMDPGETPEDAILREVTEETGLANTTLVQCLGVKEELLPDDLRVIAETTRVYTRLNLTSLDWAYCQPGITIKVERKTEGFVQIRYQEYNRLPDPQYVTFTILGWVPETVLANTHRRHFFHLIYHGNSPHQWQNEADNHHFSPFWAPLSDLPEIIHPQDKGLTFLKKFSTFKIARKRKEYDRPKPER